MTFIEEIDLALGELLVTISENTIASSKILSENSDRGRAALDSLKRLKTKAKSFNTAITMQDIKSDLSKTFPQGKDDEDLFSAVADALEAEGAKVIRPNQPGQPIRPDLT